MKTLLTALALLVALNGWAQQSKNEIPAVTSQEKPSRSFDQVWPRGRQPLYVVDGVAVMETDSAGNVGLAKIMPDLNENDMESIVVLKDSSATAQYGKNGANGVILITSKHGTPSKKRG